MLRKRGISKKKKKKKKQKQKRRQKRKEERNIRGQDKKGNEYQSMDGLELFHALCRTRTKEKASCCIVSKDCGIHGHQTQLYETKKIYIYWAATLCGWAKQIREKRDTNNRRLDFNKQKKKKRGGGRGQGKMESSKGKGCFCTIPKPNSSV